MKKPTLACLFLLFFSSSQAQPAVLQNGTFTTLDSSVLNEQRPLYIHLPAEYDFSESRYPVLVVLDADWHFRKVVGTVDHLSASEKIPSMIVVGIPNIFRDGRPARMVDLAPGMPYLPDQDEAGKFLQFIAKELIPHIDNSYRTQPHRTLVGHSLGGLFATFALLENPDAFSAYVSISPSLGRNNQQQVRKAVAFFNNTDSLKKHLYLALGNEGGNTQLGTEALVDVLQKSKTQDFVWHLNHKEEEDHVSIYQPAIHDALLSIFDGWQINEAYLSDKDISIAERHYQALSQRLGFHVPVPEAHYTQLGYNILADLDFSYAAWTFDKYLAAYPQSSQAWVGKGDAFLMQGDFTAAQKSYQTALGISPNNERATDMLNAIKALTAQ